MDTLYHADADVVLQQMIKLVFLGMFMAVIAMYVFMPLTWLGEKISEARLSRRLRERDRQRHLALRERRIEQLEKELGMYLGDIASDGYVTPKER